MPGYMDVNWIGNGTIVAYSFHYEPKQMSGSYDARYYNQIITRLHLQDIEEDKYSMQQLQQQQEKGNLHGQKSKKKILLVDDEPDSCLVYEVVLQDAGYECISYNDSVKALQEFRPNYYDLVILDIRMPKLNGFALCEKIRELDKAVQIIFITAGELYYENFRKLLQLSNDVNINCLQKPIGNEELIQIVHMTLENTN
jgi:two-component system catabolic regulation response regulator CreB/two-component system response regulator ChvI